MPTRNVNLTKELDRYVATKVRSGRYENASEVVRAGLRTLERDKLITQMEPLPRQGSDRISSELQDAWQCLF